MFYNLRLLQRGGKYYLLWTAGTRGIKYLSSIEIKTANIPAACDDILQLVICDSNNPLHRMSLVMSTKLLHGAIRIHQEQVEMLFTDVYRFIKKVRKPVFFARVDQKDVSKKRPRKEKTKTATKPPVEGETVILSENLLQKLDEQQLRQDQTFEEMFQVPAGREDQITLREVPENVLREFNERIRLPESDETFGVVDDVQFINKIMGNVQQLRDETTEEETRVLKKRAVPSDEIMNISKIPKLHLAEDISVIERQIEPPIPVEVENIATDIQLRGVEKPLPLAVDEDRRVAPRIVVDAPVELTLCLKPRRQKKKIDIVEAEDEHFYEKSLIDLFLLKGIENLLSRYSTKNIDTRTRDGVRQGDDPSIRFEPELQSTPISNIVPGSRTVGKKDTLDISAVRQTHHSLSAEQETPLPIVHTSQGLQVGPITEERDAEIIGQTMDVLSIQPVIPEPTSHLFPDDTIQSTLPDLSRAARLSTSTAQLTDDEILMNMVNKVLHATKSLDVVTIEDIAETPLRKLTISRAFMILLELAKSSYVQLCPGKDGISLHCIKLGSKLLD